MHIRKIDLMHKMFGKCEGHTCGECNNLIEGYYHDKKLRKCTVYGLTHSEASDWAKRYPACGKFNAEYDGTPIIKYVGKYRTLSGIVVDGQISMLKEDA